MGCQEVDRGSLGRRGRSGRDQLSSDSPAMMYCFVHAVLVVRKTVLLNSHILPHTPECVGDEMSIISTKNLNS